ncbi:MAG TPA: EAL domain-containing protein, partial [Acidimicrobiales bacterium]|nr:EAL domain-containing protein [Acidimicrobiales bacterium]
PPDSFIPLAEETGLIIPLGLQVLDAAIAQAVAWAHEGRDLTVSVNLSVVQLSDPTISSEILGRLRSAGVPSSAMQVEVTETAVMEHFDVARATLEELKAGGVSIVIDDFGTGYSSIARLGELPVEGIKIDRRFTALLTEDSSAERIVAAITELAHALDMRVVAEGIETATELYTVKELGCDFAQGYLLARPAPAADLSAILDARPYGTDGDGED